MNLKEYVKKYNNSTIIEENPSWGTQCVALSKHFSNVVLGIRLWSFWGSAYTGWLNKRNTFKKDLWERVENDLTDPNQIPPIWAIGFLAPTKNNKYWHTFIITKAEKWQNYFEVFEQNVWSWNWNWYDDRAKKWKYKYSSRFLGWYHKKYKDVSVEKIIENWNEFLKSINQEQAKKIKILEKENLILKWNLENEKETIKQIRKLVSIF